MLYKKILTVLFLFSACIAVAQKNFSFHPDKPKAGDVITITYEPAGDIINTPHPVEGIVYNFGSEGQATEDVILKRSGKKYTGTILTDSSQSFLFLGFSANKVFDNNFNEGYWIQLYEDGKLKKDSYANLGLFYQYYGSQVGVERNNEKALLAFEKELELNPDARTRHLPSYLRLYGVVNKEEASARVQKEIEATLKNGLKNESDYEFAENLYNLAKLPEQAKFIASLKKEKFPGGKWLAFDELNKFRMEKDPVKKTAMFKELEKKSATDKNYESLKTILPNYKSMIPAAYRGEKNWDGFKKSIAELGFENVEIAQLYNSAAWSLQEKDEELKFAEEIAAKAYQLAKAEKNNPSGKKPEYLSASQWAVSRDNTFAMIADTYAMVLYKNGQFKKGFSIAKEAAIDINKRESAAQNNTYALLAEKVLSTKKYISQLEQFVKDGKSGPDIKMILERAYVKKNKSTAGFEDYLAALEKESYLKMVEELKKSMLNNASPSFALLDLDGNKISTNDLKGKVVVVDFWATWCGPCIASFPAMQKMVNKYKDSAEVKFVFINSWENGDDRNKKAADFIKTNKYNFDVLLDSDNAVIESFKVEGIPTKFVIDKNGIIRFKSVGYNSNEEKAMAELTAMINLSASQSKAF